MLLDATAPIELYYVRNLWSEAIDKLWVMPYNTTIRIGDFRNGDLSGTRIGEQRTLKTE